MIEARQFIDQPTLEHRTLKKDLEHIRHKYGKQALQVAGFFGAVAAVGTAGLIAGEHLSSTETVDAEYAIHTVNSGDTIYGIANELYPDAVDIRDKVYEISDFQGNEAVLSDGILSTGEVLYVPTPVETNK